MSLETLPARHGKAVRLARGQSLRIVNTHGHQVVDTWAFNADDLSECMSMEHVRAALGRVFLHTGDALVTNRRRPVLTLREDSSPGVHDTLIAACDIWRYRGLGCTSHHRNCTENLAEALDELGLQAPETPSPLNLWMNIPLDAAGRVQWLPPVARPGDHVLLRAEMDCVVVMSACPQDMIPVNGMQPVDAHYACLE